AFDALRGGYDRPRDRAANRPDRRLGARESLSGHAALAGKTGRGGAAMNEQYLWDKTGQPDPELDRIEKVLKIFRHEPVGKLTFARAPLPARRMWIAPLAVAASIVLLCWTSWPR